LLACLLACLNLLTYFKRHRGFAGWKLLKNKNTFSFLEKMNTILETILIDPQNNNCRLAPQKQSTLSIPYPANKSKTSGNHAPYFKNPAPQIFKKYVQDLTPIHQNTQPNAK
jgi:hypothetical protein